MTKSIFGHEQLFVRMIYGIKWSDSSSLINQGVAVQATLRMVVIKRVEEVEVVNQKQNQLFTNKP